MTNPPDIFLTSVCVYGDNNKRQRKMMEHTEGDTDGAYPERAWRRRAQQLEQHTTAETTVEEMPTRDPMHRLSSEEKDERENHSIS